MVCGNVHKRMPKGTAQTTLKYNDANSIENHSGTFLVSIHQKYMREALKEAERAMGMGEVPVGAVVICGGEIVGRGGNRTLAEGDPTLHAEVVALRDACRNLGVPRLSGCALYVTLEPCPMCAGAIVLARFDRLFFGAYDAKAGAAGTLYAITTDSRLNHRVETHGGILDDESAALLRRFFEERRTTV